jgi:ketosteroid isomerase-like protein
MSQQNVEIVRHAFEGRRDDIFDPDFEWDFSAYAGLDLPAQGTGVKNYRRLLERYRRAWLDYYVALKELVDAGPEVVVVVHETARLKQTEMQIDRDLAQVLTMQDGKITRLRLFRTKQEALEAVGLSEPTPQGGENPESGAYPFQRRRAARIPGRNRRLRPWQARGAATEA